jgi:hypothetical protein
MGPAGLIRQVFINERGAEVFRKILPYPFLRKPFKDTAPSNTVVGNFK